MSVKSHKHIPYEELVQKHNMSATRAAEYFGVVPSRIRYLRRRVKTLGGVERFGGTVPPEKRKTKTRGKSKSKATTLRPKAAARKPAPVVKLPEPLTVQTIYKYRKMPANDLAVASGKSVREVLIMRDQLNRLIAAHLAKQRNS